MDEFLLMVFSYLCGSIPFAKIVGNYHGIDIQKHGSGNIGFSNTLRVLGWKAGLVVLPCDVLKGAIPTALARNYLEPRLILLVGIAAILGHIFPVWLKFHGGKGIATGLGVTLVISPVAACFAVFVYLIGVVIFHKSGPSSVLAAWMLPPFCLVYYPQYTLFYLGLAVITVWTHRVNLKLAPANIQ